MTLWEIEAQLDAWRKRLAKVHDELGEAEFMIGFFEKKLEIFKDEDTE